MFQSWPVIITVVSDSSQMIQYEALNNLKRLYLEVPLLSPTSFSPFTYTEVLYDFFIIIFHYKQYFSGLLFLFSPITPECITLFIHLKAASIIIKLLKSSGKKHWSTGLCIPDRKTNTNNLVQIGRTVTHCSPEGPAADPYFMERTFLMNMEWLSISKRNEILIVL